MAPPQVRVGIVVWNTAELLDRCLSALPAALAGTDAEVVVVDNASSDPSAAVAGSHTGVRVVRNPTNLGYAKAMNQALAGTTAEALVALNPDTVAPPGSLATLVERLLADPGLALVVPRLVDRDGADQYSVRCFPSPAGAAVACFVPKRWQRGRLGRRFRLEEAAGPDMAVDVDWAIGAVHVIRAEALRGRQPYDERWFMYVEDLELCWWLAQRGWRRRVEAEVAISHVGNASGELAWGRDYTGRCIDAIYDWYQRDRGPAPVRAVAALNTLAVAARAAVGVVAGRPADHVAALR
ncbi:MAG: glycosyltransferase, partial [Actinomycetota bacterium]|nr:glycosyltransferase [Actinomycetota bacterium]